MLRTLTLVCMLLCSLAASRAAGQDAYRLQPGDELDVRVVGIPNLDRRLVVEDTGEVPLPLIGRVPVAGTTVAEAQSEIARQMSGKVFRQRSVSGEIDLFSIDAQEVTVAIASFRPVYVAGNVGRPGAVEFTPGLTARRAVALAGGAGGTLLEDRDWTPQLMQARSRRRAIRAELDALEVRLARFRVQAGLETGPGEAAAIEGTEANPDEVGLDRIEQALTAAQRSDLARERAFLEEARAAIVHEIELLQDQLDSYDELVAIDDKELQRVMKLGDRGLVRAGQTVAARRSLSSSRTDRLETLSDLANRERDLVRIDYDLENLDATAVSDGLGSLADGLARRAQLQADLEGLREQILVFGGNAAELDENASVRIAITRGNDRLLVQGGGDMPLQPGDLVDVTIDLFETN